jgi:hypothetical protein
MLLLNVVQNNQELIKSLQDKVDKSTELVNSMKEEVISMQGDQLDFLNNAITHMEWAVGIGVTVIIAFAGIVGWIINRSNANAEKKMENAERVIGEAKTYIEKFAREKAELEKSRQETEGKIKELTELVNSKEIEKWTESTKLLSITSKVNQVIQRIEGMLNDGYAELQEIEGSSLEKAGLIVKVKDEYRGFREEINAYRENVDTTVIDSREAGKILLEFQKIEHRCELNIKNLRFAKSVEGKNNKILSGKE